MTVGPGSRYYGLGPTSHVDPDGNEHSILPARRDIHVAAGVAYHIVVDGDTFESLAHQYLGSSQRWWQIADLNPLLFPLDLTAGSTVRVPIGGARPGPVRTRSL